MHHFIIYFFITLVALIWLFSIWLLWSFLRRTSLLFILKVWDLNRLQRITHPALFVPKTWMMLQTVRLVEQRCVITFISGLTYFNLVDDKTEVKKSPTITLKEEHKPYRSTRTKEHLGWTFLTLARKQPPGLCNVADIKNMRKMM